MLKLRACAQLTIKRRFCLLSLAGYQSHSIGPFINKSSPPQNVATYSLKYHSPMETPNSILQGKSHHHQNRKRPGMYWKAKVRVSNHICLKQDKTPQHSHNETHETQGLATNQIQPYRHPKHTEPTSAPRINFLKHLWHINKKAIKTKTKNHIKHHTTMNSWEN